MSRDDFRSAESEYLKFGTTPDMFTPSMPGGKPGYINGVRQERSGWRDDALSLRHRAWGACCPAVDLDFVLVEYIKSEPVAIVEYKWHRAKYVELEHPNLLALEKLCASYPLPLPLFVSWYWKAPWAFCVAPINEAAKQRFTRFERLSEYDYVARLYDLRGRAFTRALEQENLQLSRIPPPDDGYPIRSPDENERADR
jgi:hypothetical protein